MRSAADELAASIQPHFPAGIAKPALRALARAGYSSLDQLQKATACELLALQGMGPKAVELIRAEFKKQCRTLRP